MSSPSLYDLGYKAGQAGAEAAPPSWADDLGKLAFFAGYRAALAEVESAGGDDWLASDLL